MRRSVGIGIGLILLSGALLWDPVKGEEAEPTGGGPPIGFYIPQFGHGVPAGSNFLLTTEVNVLNLEEDRSQYQLQTFDAEGNPLAMLRGESGAAVSQVAGEFPGRGTTRISSFVEPGQLAVGWGLLTTDDALGVEVIFNIFEASTGELLTATNVRVGILWSEASFFAFNRFRESPAASRNPLGVGSRIRSGVALLNPLGNISPAQVELSIFDASGEALGQTEMVLDLGERTSMFVDELIEDLPEFEGSIRLRSFNPQDPEEEVLIAVLPLRQEDIVLTTQLVFPPLIMPTGEGPSNRFFFIPQYGHGVPAGSNLLLTTEVFVINLEMTDSEYRIEAFDEAGDPLPALRGGSVGDPGVVTMLDGAVRAGGTARINSLSEPGQVPLGWAVLSSNDAIAVEVIFNIFDATTGEVLTSTNVGITPLITATSFFVFNEFREGPEEQSSPQGVRRRVRSGIALVAPPMIPGISDGTTAAIELYALARTGEIIGETTLVLEPGERTSMFVDDLIADLPDFDGSIELRSNDPLQATGGTPIGVLPLRQEGVILTTQALFPPRVIRERQ